MFDGSRTALYPLHNITPSQKTPLPFHASRQCVAKIINCHHDPRHSLALPDPALTMAYANIPYTPKPLTDIFTADTDIDRRKCHRVVPMKVLALGLGRTGTASLRTALKQLGFDDCYHMMSASVENPPDCLMWQDAFAAKFDGVGTFGRAEWDKLLGHCMAVCDWPAVAFAKELIEAYPEAKVLLTTRDVDSWHSSTMKTVDWRANDPELRAVAKLDWGAGLYQPMLKSAFAISCIYHDRNN